MLDEPLSALDSETRQSLQHEIIQAHANFQATTLLVSHDISGVYRLSDFVYVIENGKIQEQRKPGEVFNGTKIKPDVHLIGFIAGIENNILTVSVNNTIKRIKITCDGLATLQINDKILIEETACSDVNCCYS